MVARVLTIAVVLMGLVSCSSGSSLNPLNWFRPSGEVALVPEGGFPTDNDTRILVASLTELRVERMPGGAIIRATGVPPRQGYWDGELVPQNGEKPVDGVLTYMFRIAEPWAPTRAGTPYSRQVVVAHFVSDFKLNGVRRIQVVGENNAMAARR